MKHLLLAASAALPAYLLGAYAMYRHVRAGLDALPCQRRDDDPGDVWHVL